MDDLIEEFVGESLEALEASEAALRALNQDRTNKEAVHEILRNFHTLAGSSSFVAQHEIRQLANCSETYLIDIRDLDQPATDENIQEIALCITDLRCRIRSLHQTETPTNLESLAFAKSNEHSIENALETLARLNAEFRDHVDNANEAPASQSLRRIPGLVRHACRSLGKRVDLVIEGGDLPLDRRRHRILKDCLVHLIRNACDHGIESPEARIAAGKPERGLISISCFSDGENFRMSFSDDGRGLDRSAIQKEASNSGLLDDKGTSLSDSRMNEIVCSPGFSTTPGNEGFSGRGVGLDAVRKSVERIGGQIRLSSAPSDGTTVTLILPYQGIREVTETQTPGRISEEVVPGSIEVSL